MVSLRENNLDHALTKQTAISRGWARGVALALGLLQFDLPLTIVRVLDTSGLRWLLWLAEIRTSVHFLTVVSSFFIERLSQADAAEKSQRQGRTEVN